MIIEEKPEKYAGIDWWAERSKKLLNEEKIFWPLLKTNYQNFEKIRIRDFSFEGFTVKILFAPDRIKSSSADVRAEAIKARKCFLCTANLPVEQSSLIFNKHFSILANPYPIFPEHLTISKRNHTPQTIIGNFADLLDTAKALGKYYTIFYNGPKCGSSAPDHMHFQAGSKQIMPIEYEFNKMVNKLPRAVIGNSKTEVRFFEEFLRYFISVESKDRGELLFVFKTFVNAFKKLSVPHNEPMMNLIANFEEDIWRLIIFPRQIHRPAQYFAEDGKQLLISPAAVDMGGIFITPHIDDFEKINSEDVIDIYRQVTISKEYFEYLRKKIGEIFI